LRILVTGAGGFVGGHLVEALLQQPDTEVWGTLKPDDPSQHPIDRVHSVPVDLCDPAAVNDLLTLAKPQRIYHLAGQAFVPVSWADPWDTLSTNIRSQLNIFQSCLQCGLGDTRTLVIGSQEEYGRLTEAEMPATEASPFRPDNPYGVSKVAQDLLGQAYFLRHGLPVVRVQPFNHIGPRQNARFVASDFACQIVAIERGELPPIIRVGNLDAERDFTDVRDVVQAYLAALEKGQPGDSYVVASGIARPVRTILDGLLAHSTCSVTVEVDPAKFRVSDTPRQFGDSSKLRAATGWQPQIPFAQTLADILNYERQSH
jgi:GDP-4-dehydro-6-deoxy-D-mannose reductase